MQSTVRKSQLYSAFINTIRSVGVEQLKDTSLFLTKVDREEEQQAKAA